MHYSTIVVFFICLIQKDQPFAWGVEVEIVFQFLKVFFTITLFLICVNLSRIFILEMDIFYFALNIVLSHATWRDDFHLVDFYFHKVFPIENNNEIYVNKLFAIVDAFEEWHHLLKGLQHDMFVYFNHKNFWYLMITRVLNGHLVQWAFLLLQLQLVITYCLRG